MTYDDMSIAQKAECLALAEFMKMCASHPAGKQFVIDLFLSTLKKANLELVDKALLADLRARATGT